MDEAPDPRRPNPSPGEVEMILEALERSRRTFAWKCGGLDDNGLRQSLPSSAMTLGGLLKHLALVESHYTAVAFLGGPLGDPWDRVDPAEWPDWEWRSAAADSAADLYALWESTVDRTRHVVGDLLRSGGLDQATKLTAKDGRVQNLRRVLVDLHEEYARHTGHADLLRESIDGLVGEDPPQSNAPRPANDA
jgi:uncharacterized damage-inducible protein DinB